MDSNKISNSINNRQNEDKSVIKLDTSNLHTEKDLPQVNRGGDSNKTHTKSLHDESVVKTGTEHKESVKEALVKELEEHKRREQDNQKKIKELGEVLEKEKEVNKQFKTKHQIIIDEKNREIKEKEKAVLGITVTNSKLMQTLAELKKEVDEQLDKVSVKQVNDKIKKLKEENKQNPLDIVVKVKEKELKNANVLIEILKKDKDQLQKALDIHSDFKNISEITDKLKLKEKENLELLQEIKLLNRTLEEHKRCPNMRREIENEMKVVKDDYKAQKDNMRILIDKMKEEEKNSQRTMQQLIDTKKELDKVNKKVASGKDSSINKLIDKSKALNLNHDNNLAEVLKNADELDDTVKVHKSSEIKKVSSTNQKVSKVNISSRSVNLEPKQKKVSVNKVLASENKLFTEEEKSALEKVIPVTDLHKFEKKFESLDHSRQSVENKHKSDVKILMRKIADQEERLDLINAQLKEAEHKNKISHFQVNEYKNEQKAYQRKLNELQAQIDTLYSMMKEKDQENKILIQQLGAMRKVVKHNALPPLDNEIAKHLEKIKSEDSPSFNNEINDILDNKTGSNVINVSNSQDFIGNKSNDIGNLDDEENDVNDVSELMEV